jgi:signal transduction histidine kinase
MLNSRKRESTLENRLFISILYIGILIVILLILYDSLFTGDIHSVVIEIISLIIFIVFLLFTRKKDIRNVHKNTLTILLFVLINIGWVTGAGVNLLNTGLLFLCVSIALVLNEKRIYPVIFIIVVIDLAGLFLMQFHTDLVFSSKYAVEKHLLLNNYLTASFFIFSGSFLIAFLKLNYNTERANLQKVNNLLREKSDEISQQNKELNLSKETLDKTILKLESQASELLSIKESLEEKVNARTNDLMRLNERLIAQNQQLEQYAYITSHNLRSPIAQIKGLIQVLPKDNKLDDLTNETLKRIRMSVENLEKVFSDLSDILKVEKTMQQPWQNVDLFTKISNVVDALKTPISDKRIRVVMPTQQNITIKALKPYVYSVIHNIIENAVKYADMNKENRFIKIAISESQKHHVVSITDNGIGIDMDVASGKIFSMYQRFNNTHPGQGFGLFMVKSQMDAMEGKVELESILGQGTTFSLYFPKR